MNEWLILEVLMLKILDKMSSIVLFSLDICTCKLNLENFSLVNATYFSSKESLVCASPLTKDITSCDSLYNLTSSSLVSHSNVRPMIKASYSSSLLVMLNSKHKDTLTVNPTLLSKVRLYLLPLLMDNPSVNTVHVPLGYKVANFISSRKYPNT